MKFPRVTFCTALRSVFWVKNPVGLRFTTPLEIPRSTREPRAGFSPPGAAFVLSEITESSLRFAILALLCKKPTHL